MTKPIEPWKQPIITDGKGNITEPFWRWLELFTKRLNILIDAVFNGKFPLIIETAEDDYQFKFADTVNCDGTFDVTLPDAADAFKEHTTTSTNGTITLLADATIQPPTTVSTDESVTVYFARGQWWHK